MMIDPTLPQPSWQDAHYHRSEAQNLRRQAAVLDRYESNYSWLLNADEIELNRDVAADLRQRAEEHERLAQTREEAAA